jgi:uncharacterized 2Fe-2S/4Fe-4S cluster protein (DUF4445 family)
VSDRIILALIPLGVSLEVERGAPLTDVLAEYGVEFPCGGSELCGGCRVRVIEGTLPAGPEDQCVFSEEELAQGWRLACRARPKSPVKLEVGQWTAPVLADFARLRGGEREGLGIAIDLGTTTIAVQLIQLATGEVLAVRTSLNPQSRYGADVMNRILHALSSPDLTHLIRKTLGDMVSDLVSGRGNEVREVVLAGNTVMHHLFAGLDVESLSHAPFNPTDVTEQVFSSHGLGWTLAQDCRIRFLPCLGGFIGSDILAGILAVELPAYERLAVLIDLGTNGEIVLGNRERILCASTAAGPAFEGGAIRMGMRAASGAITHVFVREGTLRCRVIGSTPARGICGSGIVDAVAAGLETGKILPGGGLADGARELPIAGPVVLTQTDIRELQLAKAALDEIEAVHLAGAFGNYVRVESAVRIGLLETAPCKILPAGNAALRGAKMMLLAPDLRVPVPIEYLSLATAPGFQEAFLECLQFPAL